MTLALPERAAPAPAAPMPSAVQYVPAPGGIPADAPTVFAAINAVMRDAMPVGKNQRNTQQNYQFRGIDDVMSAMAGPMRAHGLFILPELASHKQERRGEKMTHTVIMMRYHVYGPAGDCLVATVPGEASDFADKATNKAQSAALKYLLFTLFMLPVDGRSIDDGDRDRDHPQPPAEHRAEQAAKAQRQQKPRRGQRAEQAPAAAQQNRDYLAEAKAAPTPQAFAKVRTAAKAAGAPPEFLAELDGIAQQRKAAADAKAAQAAPGPTASTAGSGTTAAAATERASADRVDEVTDAAGEASWQGEPARQAAAEHATALADMYAAAHAVGMESRDEADKAFTSHFQCQPAAATVAQLREQAATLRQIAGAA
jgi:hypothetical protein